MKRILFILATLFCIASLPAQNYNKYFTQNIHERGKLYFVFPQKMKGVKGDSKKAYLSYDFTYLDSENKVSLLTTCFTKEPFVVDSIHVVLPSGRTQSYGIEKIYNERKKGYWNGRNRCYIDFSLWCDMFQGTEPYRLILSSVKGKRIDFTFSKKSWKKNKEIINFLQTLIEMNRN